MEIEYSAIIGVHKGVGNIPLILDALNNQTLQPKEIIIVADGKETAESLPALFSSKINFSVVSFFKSKGCFARFSVALMMKTNWVMILDDDTVPGIRWAANCMDTAQRLIHKNNLPPILGSRGIILTADSYRPFKEAGLYAHNDTVQSCDLVGHSWFIHKSHIHKMWGHKPINYTNGEDIHLSATNYLHHGGGITACPPHPANDKTLWGSTRPDLGLAPGRMSTNPTHYEQRDEIVQYWIGKGWRPLFKGGV